MKKMEFIYQQMMQWKINFNKVNNNFNNFYTIKIILVWMLMRDDTTDELYFLNNLSGEI